MEDLTPTTTRVRGPGRSDEQGGVRCPGACYLAALHGSVAALFEVGVVGLYFFGMRPDIFWGGKEDFPTWILPMAAAFVSALLATVVCGWFRKLTFEDLRGALGVRCALTSLLPAVIGGVARRDLGDAVSFLGVGFSVLTVFGLPGWIAGTAAARAVTSLLPGGFRKD